MFMRNSLAFAASLALILGAGSATRADGPGLGKRLGESDVKEWDISILPDGTNLPPGSGTPAQGAATFAIKCALCHGENGKGGVNAALVGRDPPLTSGIDANKTIANFWEYPTTLFDYVRRAMPWPSPRTLTDEEVYGLVAFILAQNEIIGEDAVMNAQSLPKVKMPNRNGFVIKFPDKI
jgi:cytochrome c553